MTTQAMEKHHTMFKSRPIVSVITVSYNAEATIGDTIESVLQQTEVAWEYIVIDGRSNDSTTEIIKKYQEQIDFWLSEPDGGIYDAMNKGLAQASGDWIIFLNADDYFLEPGSLSTLLKAASSDVSIVAGGTIISSEGILQRFQPSRFFGLEFQLPFMHPSTMVRRSAFQLLGSFDTKYRIAADCDFLLRLINANLKYSMIDIPTTVMRSGGASVKNFHLSRKEYRDAYTKNTGDRFGAWLGYLFSMLFFVIGQAR